MRLYLRQRVLSMLGMKNYDVCDENGKLLYAAEQQLRFPKELRVYDDRNCWVGTVKRKLFSLRKTFVLVENGGISEEIRRTGTKKRYRFFQKGWLAHGSRFAGDFRIFDGEGKPVAVIDDGCQGCTVEISEREDHLTVLLFALAVQHGKNSIGI